MKTEEGAGTFSLIKHTLLVLVGVLFFAWFADGEPWQRRLLAGRAAWLIMIAVAYALPQLLYRRTTGHWLLPLVPLLRGLALAGAPVRRRCSISSSRWSN